MISFLKRKRFMKGKIIGHYLSNSRDVHQNYCAIILNNIKYRQSSIKYIIKYISYLQISSNIIRHIIQHIIIYILKYIKHTKCMRYINMYIIKYISFFFCWMKLFKLNGCSKGLN